MMRKGMQILNDPFKNKGTAFTMAERRELGLLGLLPTHVRTIEEQAAETYALYQSKTSGIEKRHLLMEIFNTNRTLFFYLMKQHITEFMPIVYDPVIAESIEQYDERYLRPQDAAYLDVNHPEDIATELAEAKAADLLKWTGGRALVATGIPAGTINYDGVDYHIGQANNALIYPGVGFGALAAQAKLLNDEMIAAAAHALSGIVDPDQPGAAVLPPVEKLADFSKRVAITVAQSAIDQDLAGEGITDAQTAVEKMTWEAKY